IPVVNKGWIAVVDRRIRGECPVGKPLVIGSRTALYGLEHPRNPASRHGDGRTPVEALRTEPRGALSGRPVYSFQHCQRVGLPSTHVEADNRATRKGASWLRSKRLYWGDRKSKRLHSSYVNI